MHSWNALYVRGDAGFRLWWTDLITLAIAAAIAACVWTWPLRPGYAVATVVGHFFLFCNITRARPRDELLWALSYSALGVWLVGGGRLDWLELLGVIAPLTIAQTLSGSRAPTTAASRTPGSDAARPVARSVAPSGRGPRRAKPPSPADDRVPCWRRAATPTLRPAAPIAARRPAGRCRRDRPAPQLTSATRR